MPNDRQKNTTNYQKVQEGIISPGARATAPFFSPRLMTNQSKFTSWEICNSTFGPKVVQGTTLMYIRPTNDSKIKWILYDIKLYSRFSLNAFMVKFL